MTRGRETGGNVVRWWPAGPVRGHLFLFKVDMTRLIAAKLTGTRYTRARVAPPVENDHNSPTAKRSTYNTKVLWKQEAPTNLITNSCLPILPLASLLYCLQRRWMLGSIMNWIKMEAHFNSTGRNVSVCQCGYASGEDCSTIVWARQLHWCVGIPKYSADLHERILLSHGMSWQGCWDMIVPRPRSAFDSSRWWHDEWGVGFVDATSLI